jgi:hypothetical protein
MNYQRGDDLVIYLYSFIAKKQFDAARQFIGSGLMMAAIAALMGIASAAQAQHAHDGDVEVFAEAGELMLSHDFVEAEFESENPGTLPYQVSEPGFVAEKEPPLFESPLPDGALFGFDVEEITLNGDSRSLWYWDGGDGVTPPTAANFVASPHRLRVSHPSSAQSIVVDGVNGAAGFFFGQANVDPMDDEVLHTHLLFTLVDDSGDPVLNPAEGIYLFKTSHYAEVDGPPLLLLDGNPELYWVAGLGVEEEAHEMAVEFVVDEFGLAIPEPTAAILIGLGGIFISGARRRRNA